jgi:hypothetical protein
LLLDLLVRHHPDACTGLGGRQCPGDPTSVAAKVRLLLLRSRVLCYPRCFRVLREQIKRLLEIQGFAQGLGGDMGGDSPTVTRSRYGCGVSSFNPQQYFVL